MERNDARTVEFFEVRLIFSLALCFLPYSYFTFSPCSTKLSHNLEELIEEVIKA